MCDRRAGVAATYTHTYTKQLIGRGRGQLRPEDSLRHALALKAASGEPASPSLRHLGFDMRCAW